MSRSRKVKPPPTLAEQKERATQHAFALESAGMGGSADRHRNNTDKDVGSGSYIWLTKAPNIHPETPDPYGIYWATPVDIDGRDCYGRFAVHIVHKNQTINIFQDEYIRCDDVILKMVREDGEFYVAEDSIPSEAPPCMEDIERCRALCEEEREIIWALQVDGLTESAACSEYLYGKHIDNGHHGWHWKPTQEYLDVLQANFG